jgi:N utilization substance protein A
MKSEFLIAITQLAAERNLPRDVVLGAVEAALILAFKKDHLAELDLAVRISPQTGDVHVFAKRTVVAEGAVEDPNTQLGLSQAQAVKADVQVGAVLEEEVTPANAGRIAAQTAKQVVMQRLREAERELVFSEYAGKEGELVSGTVQRFEGRSAILELGRAEAVLPPSEQAPTERYRPGTRVKVLLLEVGKTAKGPAIVASRTHKNLLRRLFELEVPEVHSGVVQIEAIAREPGARSKVAVRAVQERVDPVGACVGLRGVRIQNIVNELHGEKIDVLEWSPDPAVFIARALAPAQVLYVIVKPEEKTAIVVVPDRQLALAIGREGQNARLAAKLTGWRIDIKSSTEAEVLQLAPAPTPASAMAQPRSVPVPAAPPPVAVPAPAAAEASVPEPVPAPAGAEAEPAEAEAPSLAEALAKKETWQVGAPAAAPAGRGPGAPAAGIRFAEEILGGRSGPPKAQKKGKGDRDEGKGGKRKGRERPDLREIELDVEE